MAIVFSLDNNAGGLFAIDATSGVISRAGTLTAGSSYNVAVRITDTATGRYTGFTDTITATAAVNVVTGVLGGGDSIMRGYPLANPPTDCFLGQFSAATGLPIFNSGNDGETLASINSGWASSGHAARYNAANLNTYLLEGGGADFRDQSATAAQVQASTKGIIAQAKAAGYICFVTTTLPQAGLPAGTSPETERSNYNAWLKANWQTFADGIVDIAGLPQISDPTNQTYYSSDGVHPIYAGHTAMANAVISALTGQGAASSQTATLSSGERFDTVAISAASSAPTSGTLAGVERADSASIAASTSTPSTAALSAGEQFDTASIAANSTAAGGGTSAVAWSATDKDPAVTKTSDTRVDRASASGNANASIRALVARSATRRYIEYTVTALGGQGGIVVGIADAAAAMTNNYLGSDSHSMGFWSNGADILANSFPDYGIGNWAAGDVICLDWDPSAKTIRARRNNGAWGAALNISALTAPFYPAVTFTNVAPSAVTANFGDTAFAFTPPSGAVAWNVT